MNSEPIPSTDQTFTYNSSSLQTYFVCGSPGLDEWIELPIVTPEQIVTSRLLVRGFTGDLDTPVNKDDFNILEIRSEKRN